MINNNTNDVAYLGCYGIEDVSNQRMINDYTRCMVRDCPSWKEVEVSDAFLFDCNGCRYGFRIKQLKTK